MDGRIPRWAWLVAGCLVAAALAVFALGRGGTAVLLGAALAFGALACLLLSEPDRDPAAEDGAEQHARRAE
jgi:hypothetical protein